MKSTFLAKTLVDVVFKGQDLPVILREQHEDGGDYNIANVSIEDGKVNIWFNKDFPIKK